MLASVTFASALVTIATKTSAAAYRAAAIVIARHLDRRRERLVAVALTRRSRSLGPPSTEL